MMMKRKAGMLQAALLQGGAENYRGRGSFYRAVSRVLSTQERFFSFCSSTVSHTSGPSLVLVFLETVLVISGTVLNPAIATNTLT